MRYSSLHTHTTFSDGAHTMEQMVQSAISLHMDTLGFSDHSFTACDTSYCMDVSRYPEYLAQLQLLKARYAGQLNILAGMELDYYSAHPTENLDYTIASVHYIVHDGICYPIDHSRQQQLDCIQTVFGGDVLQFAARYYEILTDHVRKSHPSLVGHFDVITKFGLIPEEDPAYRAIARQALKEILSRCKYIELNTGAIARGLRSVPYPAPYLWDTVKENGGHIVLSSDCHHKDNLIFYFDEAVAQLRAHGIDHICVPGKDGFVKMDI